MTALPQVINFIPRMQSGIIPCRHFYRVLGKRPPKKGEFYLSGAIVEAYEAIFDMHDEYIVVEKGPRAKRVTVEVPA